MSKASKIYVLNGPNLNLLGDREPDIYGSVSLKDIEKSLSSYGKENNIEIYFKQSNHEGEIIDNLHQALENNFDGIIINPGAYTHYSYAIRDAISAIKIDTIEVHLSNIYDREEFRRNSVLKDVCLKQIVGQGKNGYLLAIRQFIYKTN